MITAKDYESKTLGRRVPGHITDADALWRLRYGHGPETVIIPETLKVEYYFDARQPHPECRAEHVTELKPWSAITVRAFPGIPSEHRTVVESLGAFYPRVRVPIIQPMTALITEPI